MRLPKDRDSSNRSDYHRGNYLETVLVLGLVIGEDAGRRGARIGNSGQAVFRVISIGSGVKVFSKNRDRSNATSCIRYGYLETVLALLALVSFVSFGHRDN